MSTVILTLEQAKEWFLTHSEGGVDVKRKDDMIFRCYSYPEAKAWLTEGVAILDDKLIHNPNGDKR